jgi:hypothetical protein
VLQESQGFQKQHCQKVQDHQEPRDRLFHTSDGNRNTAPNDDGLT